MTQKTYPAYALLDDEGQPVRYTTQPPQALPDQFKLVARALPAVRPKRVEGLDLSGLEDAPY